MSRKFLSLFSDKKQKNKSCEVLPDDYDTNSSHFGRRVSVSNSGRWKQKNKQRSIVHEDIFKPQKDEEKVKSEEKKENEEKSTDKLENDTENDKKMLYETSF